jgi:hypothetical protein
MVLIAEARLEALNGSFAGSFSMGILPVCLSAVSKIWMNSHS